jgi:hypothetical protein
MYVPGPPLVAGIQRMRSIPSFTCFGVGMAALPMPWMATRAVSYARATTTLRVERPKRFSKRAIIAS